MISISVLVKQNVLKTMYIQQKIDTQPQAHQDIHTIESIENRSFASL